MRNTQTLETAKYVQPYLKKAARQRSRQSIDRLLGRFTGWFMTGSLIGLVAVAACTTGQWYPQLKAYMHLNGWS